MSHNKSDAPKDLPELFERMKIVSRDMIAKIARTKSSTESYWYDLNQSTWNLQDLLNGFADKIESLPLEELSCRVICAFRVYTDIFIRRQRSFTMNFSYEIRGKRYHEAKRRAGNTVVLLEKTCEKLEARLNQLIADKVATEKREREEGTEYC